jgi:WD40 repeat protein/Tfp pilus assembly protein PilF
MSTVEANPIAHPYPGLRAFETDEAEIFFGREEHVDDLLARFQRRRFLGVVGPSGCGKSSLVRAGMIPALHGGMVASAGCGWQIAVLRPGTQPLKNLAHAFWHATGRAGIVDEDEFLHTVLARGPLGLVDALAEYEFAGGNNLLLLVDQFEELFRITQGGESSEARAFVDLLLTSARTERFPIYVILTMRSDFLGHCPVFRGLPEALNDSQYLTPRLNREQQRAAIEGPAALFNTTLQPELVNRILNEMGADPDQLPLMQHLLMRMWWKERQKVGNDDQPLELTTDTYRLVGGLHGCISSHAERIYTDLKNDEQRVAELLFRRLAEVTPDARLIRRARRYGELCRQIAPQEGSAQCEALHNVIEAFRQEGRSFLMPPQAEELADDSLIDISHESVIRQWTRLKDWVLDENKISRVSRIVVEKAARWKEMEEDKNYLLFGVELAEAKAWRDKYPTQLGEDERRLLAESIKYEEEDVRKAEALKFTDRLKRMNRRLWILLGIAVICLILAMVFWSRARHNEQAAKDNADDAINQAAEAGKQAGLAKENEKKSKHSLSNLVAERGHQLIQKGDLTGSQLWYTRALELDKEAEVSDDQLRVHSVRLGAGMQHLPRPSEILLHEMLTSASFSPDGRHILTTGQDGTVRVWDVNGNLVPSHQTLAPIANVVTAGWTSPWALTVSLRIAARVNWAAFSPDREGRFVVAGSGTPGSGWGEVCLSRAETGTVIWRHPYRGAVNFVAFSPDGRWVLAAGEAERGQKGEASILSVKDGELILRMEHQKGPVNHAAFSPGNGRYVVTASGQPGSRAGEAQVWNIFERRRLPTPDFVFAEAVNHAEFSPDGRFVIAAAGDQGSETSQARIMELPIGRMIRRPLIHNGGVTWASFSPDGHHLVTASHDGTAKVWNWNAANLNAHPLWSFKHGSSVYCANFSPDGRYVVTGSRDRTARVWEIATGDAATPPLNDTGTVSVVEFSHDGYRVLAGSADSVRVWHLAVGAISSPLLKTTGWVHRVACSAAGRRVLTISGQWREGVAEMLEAQVWNTGTGEPITEPLKHDGLITCAALSQDGHWVATAAGREGKAPEVAIWSAGDSARRVPLQEAGVVRFAVFNGKSDRLLTAGPGQSGKPWTLRLWDTKTGALLRTLEESELGEDEAVNCAAFSPNGLWVAAGSGKLTASTGKAQVWEVETGKKVTPLLLHNAGEGGVLQLAFSNDSHLLVTASADDSAKVWDIDKKGQQVGKPFAHTADVTFAAFGPDDPDDKDNKLLVTASRDQTVVVWDVKTGANRATFRHDSYPNHAAFNSDGRLVVTASHDGTARIWDVASNSLVTILRHQGDVQFACFGPAKDQLITVSYRVPPPASEQMSPQRLTPPQLQPSKVPPSGTALVGETQDRKVKVRIWNIAPDRHKVEDLRSFGQLLSARELHEGPNREMSLLAVKEANTLSEFWKATKKDFLVPQVEAKHKSDAEECEATGLWFAAAWQLGRQIRQEGDNPDLFARRGHAHAQLLQWDKAYDDYSQALELLTKAKQQALMEENQMKWEKERIRASANMEFNQRIVRADSQILANQPGNREALLRRAGALDKLEQWEQAVQDYVRAIELDPEDLQVRLNCAKAYLQLGKWKEAEAICNETLRMKQDLPELWLLLGQALAGLGEWEEACSKYSKIVEDPRRNSPDLQNAARLGQAWLSRARASMNLHKQLEAREDYRQAAQFYDRQAADSAQRAAVYDPRAAVYDPRAAVYDPRAAVYDPRAARTLDEATNKSLDAIAANSEALDIWPKDWQHLHWRGKAYSYLHLGDKSINDYTIALKLLKEVWALAPAGSEVTMLDSPLALTIFLAFRSEREKKESEILQSRALVYISLDHRDTALGDYTDALKVERGDPKLWQERARLYVQLQEWDNAVRDYTAALKLKQNNDLQLLYNRGVAYTRVARWKEAAVDFESALNAPRDNSTVQPTEYTLRWNLARAQSNLGHWQDAAISYDKMLKSQPKNTWLWTQKARAQAESGEWAESAASLEASKQDRTIWRPRALVHLKEPNLEAYRQLCADLIKRFSETTQADLANEVAWTCLLAPGAVGDNKLLVELAEKAVKGQNNYNYQNTLGVALYRAERYDEAVQALERARKLSPAPVAGQRLDQAARAVLPGEDGTAVDWLFLAMSHHRLEHTEEAKKWLAKAEEAIDQYKRQKIHDASDARLTWNRIELELFRSQAEALLKQGRQ